MIALAGSRLVKRGRVISSGKYSLVAVSPSTTTTTAAAAAPATATAISAIPSTTAAPTAEAAASAAALSLGTRLVDVDRTSADGGAIEGRDGLLAVFVAGHLDEAEPTGSPRVTVRHDAHAVHLSERLKQLPEFVFACVEAQVSHKNILHASASALSCRKCEQFGGLGRSGGPFLKIDTGAGEQSNAASSIAGFLKPACQIDLKMRAHDSDADELALVHLPVSLSVKSHLQ
jgi:hypothetical protein